MRTHYYILYRWVNAQLELEGRAWGRRVTQLFNFFYLRILRLLFLTKGVISTLIFHQKWIEIVPNDTAITISLKNVINFIILNILNFFRGV